MKECVSRCVGEGVCGWVGELLTYLGVEELGGGGGWVGGWVSLSTWV